MCFSAEVSLSAFILGLSSSILLYRKGQVFDRIVALYFAYISFMQGIEWLLWNHQTCDDYHKQLSRLGMIINLSQPIILGIMLIYFTGKNIAAILAIMLLYFLCTLLIYFLYTPDLQCTTPRPNDPHLVWNWTLLPYHYIISWTGYITAIMGICLLGMPSIKTGIVSAAIYLISMLLSMIVYPREDAATMWCFISSGAPLTYYICRRLGYSLQ